MFATGRDESEKSPTSQDGEVPRFRIIHGGQTAQAFSLGSLRGAIEMLEQVRDNVTVPMDGLADVSARLAGLGDEELSASVLLLERARRSLDSLSAVVLGEMDIRDVANTAHGMRTGSWLAREADLPAGGARSQVNVAKKLRSQLPTTKSALDEGRIGFQHAKVLADAANCRIIDAFNDFIPELIDLIPLMSFEHWKRRVTAVADLLDQDGGHKPGDEITDNTLRLSPSWQGVLHLDGQLTGDGALTVSNALNERADQIFHRLKRDTELSADLPTPPRKTLLAMALVELVREALGKEKGSTIAPRTEVSLIINADDPDTVTDDRGTPIGDTTRFTMTCDPVFKPVVVNVEGIVVDLGRDQRLASKALHDALAHRDGGCIWPGCDSPSSWCDAHHTHHWRQGGNTDRENLASLCRYHHGVSHRKGWAMHKTADQWFWWQSPRGDTFWSQRHGVRREGPPPPPKVPTATGHREAAGGPEPPGRAT